MQGYLSLSYNAVTKNYDNFFFFEKLTRKDLIVDDVRFGFYFFCVLSLKFNFATIEIQGFVYEAKDIGLVIV